MKSGDYLLFPAEKTVEDTGFVRLQKPARLVRNDGSEQEWHYDSTEEAKYDAKLFFGVEGWHRDDLGILFSDGSDE